MGRRGPGAITPPKPPKKANGRPRIQSPQEILRMARAMAPVAFAYLLKLIADPTIETKYKVRATALLLEQAGRAPRTDAGGPIPDGQQQPGGQPQRITISFDPNWGAKPGRVATKRTMGGGDPGSAGDS